MQLYDVKITKRTNIEAFHSVMRERFPGIIGRKRFCFYEDEYSEELESLLREHNVAAVPVGDFPKTNEG